MLYIKYRKINNMVQSAPACGTYLLFYANNEESI